MLISPKNRELFPTNFWGMVLRSASTIWQNKILNFSWKKKRCWLHLEIFLAIRNIIKSGLFSENLNIKQSPQHHFDQRKIIWKSALHSQPFWIIKPDLNRCSYGWFCSCFGHDLINKKHRFLCFSVFECLCKLLCNRSKLQMFNGSNSICCSGYVTFHSMKVERENTKWKPSTHSNKNRLHCFF